MARHLSRTVKPRDSTRRCRIFSGELNTIICGLYRSVGLLPEAQGRQGISGDGSRFLAGLGALTARSQLRQEELSVRLKQTSNLRAQARSDRYL